MRLDMLIASLKNEVFAVEPNFASSIAEGLAGGGTHTELAQDSVTYQKIGSIAVIGVDGAMYKKNLSGMCMSVASYDQIESFIDKAEADAGVEKIVFRVDTPGGSVAGAESVRNRIANSTKDIDTFFENMGASAGWWIFSASKRIFATPTTILGSIGVIIMYQEPEEKTLAIVSSSAPNKYCDIKDEKCKGRIQTRLNEYETIFTDILTARFDKPKEQIVADFDHGATIFATQAHKLGYIDGVMEFKDYLEKPLPDKEKESKTTNQGESMNMEQMRSEHPDVVAAIETAATQALTERNTELQAQVAEAVATAEAKDTMTANLVAMATEMGASVEALGAALAQDNETMGENVMLKAINSTGAVTTGEGSQAADEEFALKNI